VTDNSDQLLSPKEVVEYLRQRYGLVVSLPSFYSMISRKDCPPIIYFRKRPKFTKAAVDYWIAKQLISSGVIDNSQ
jgi:hypothetical protein